MAISIKAYKKAANFLFPLQPVTNFSKGFANDIAKIMENVNTPTNAFNTSNKAYRRPKNKRIIKSSSMVSAVDLVGDFSTFVCFGNEIEIAN
jgi:hypothetical protein